MTDDDELQFNELISPEDFSAAWQAVRVGEPFELRISNDVQLHGSKPEGDDDVFNAIHPASLAHRVLSVATRYSEIKYAMFVNGVLVMFDWPLGWSWLPDNSYAAGWLPKGWKNMYAVGAETIQQLVDTRDHDDS